MSRRPTTLAAKRPSTSFAELGREVLAATAAVRGDRSGRYFSKIKNIYSFAAVVASLRAIFFLSVLSYAVGLSQESFPRVDLKWSTLTTPHFTINYHEGNERVARETAEIAESVYGPVTTMYGHVPDERVNFVLRDHDDYSNGAAYFYDNKVEIWVPALDFELRGTHPWLRNVVTHEYTHIIQMQTAMKWSRRSPAVYLQWLGYESERRPDVLYGYPNVLASYPISGFVVPSWFAEGTAQYNHPSFRYDYWDAHRDMILRMHILEGRPLSWEEMAVFGKTSLGNESSYNAGFSIIEYIGRTYGDSAIVQISRALSSPMRGTIDGAVEQVLGISGQQLYDQWMAARRGAYERVREEIAPTRTEGDLVAAEGFGNFHPVFSPDGRKIYYTSNAGEDYFGLSDLMEFDRTSGKRRSIVSLVRSALSISPDGRFLYYARVGRNNPRWASISDLYRYDLKEEDETRLTHGWRAFSPRLSPDGKRLVFAIGGQGTLNVGVSDVDGKNLRRLTNFANGEQVFTPVWDPSGTSIAFGYAEGHGQTVAVMDTAGERLSFIGLSGDSRNPSFSPDGHWMYFAWDTMGRFNIWRRATAGGTLQQVTQVLGGAFQPSVDDSGNVAFARYDASGYKIALLGPAAIVPAKMMFETSSNASGMTAEGPRHLREAMTPQNFSDNRQSSIDNRQFKADSLQPRPYRSIFSDLSIFPLLRIDNYNTRNKGIDVIKPGFYFVSSELLDKLTLFGGAAINRRLERDLFFIFEYRDKLPLLSLLGLEPTASLELYNLTRVTNSSFSLYVRDPQPIDIGVEVTYNLLEFDATLRQNIGSEHAQLMAGYTRSRYEANLGSFQIPTVGLQQAFRNVYLIGTNLWLQGTLRDIHPTVDESINPVGRTVVLRYTYENNDYNRDLEYDIRNGLLVPLYKVYKFHRWEMNWAEHLRLPISRHTLSLSVRGGAITGGAADTIFHFYGGGLVGLKGYPFYSIEGTRVLQFSGAYRFPIATHLDTRFLQFYFTKLYASVFAEVGDAWTGGFSEAKWRKDAGVELRLESFSFYSYPTRFSIAGAYGFDRFTRQVQGESITYGKEWRFYLSILFDFNFGEPFGNRMQEVR